MARFSKTTRFSTLFFCLNVLRAYGHEAEAQLPFEHPHAHESVEGHVHTGWESRYFSEGRDSLDGDSLQTSSVEVGWEHVSVGIWYGRSPDQTYDELQLAFALTQSIGDFELYVGYTHLQFPSAGTHDDEIGVGFAWPGLPMEFELAADAYYSFDADGVFVEFSATREIEITNRLSLGISGIFGLNQGYVADGHDGANHLAARLGAQYAITDSVSLTAHTTYSWALARDSTLPGDAQLIDFSHSDIGLQWSF